MRQESPQIDGMGQTKTHHGGVGGHVGGSKEPEGKTGGHGNIADVFIQEKCCIIDHS